MKRRETFSEAKIIGTDWWQEYTNRKKSEILLEVKANGKKSCCHINLLKNVIILMSDQLAWVPPKVNHMYLDILKYAASNLGLNHSDIIDEIKRISKLRRGR